MLAYPVWRLGRWIRSLAAKAAHRPERHEERQDGYAHLVGR
jgi:hypothetical protein